MITGTALGTSVGPVEIDRQLGAVAHRHADLLERDRAWAGPGRMSPRTIAASGCQDASHAQTGASARSCAASVLLDGSGTPDPRSRGRAGGGSDPAARPRCRRARPVRAARRARPGSGGCVGVTPGAPLTGIPPAAGTGTSCRASVTRILRPSTQSRVALADFLDALLAERGIDWERTVIGGFSMGCVMALTDRAPPGPPVAGRDRRLQRVHRDGARLGARPVGARGAAGVHPPRSPGPDHLGRLRSRRRRQP